MCAGEGAGVSAAWVEEQLAEARTRLDLPALARRDSVLMADTRLSNIFTCQPQQKNSEKLTACITAGTQHRLPITLLDLVHATDCHIACWWQCTAASLEASSAGASFPVFSLRSLKVHTIPRNHEVQDEYEVQYWHCRRAFELAFATAYLFAGCRPTFVHVGEITFQKPVEVGDLLRLHSTVLHTSESRAEQVRHYQTSSLLFIDSSGFARSDCSTRVVEALVE